MLRWADQVRDGADGLLTCLGLDSVQEHADYGLVNYGADGAGPDDAAGELWVLADFARSFVPLTPDEFVRVARDEFRVDAAGASCLREVVLLTGVTAS